MTYSINKDLKNMFACLHAIICCLKVVLFQIQVVFSHSYSYLSIPYRLIVLFFFSFLRNIKKICFTVSPLYWSPIAWCFFNKRSKKNTSVTFVSVYCHLGDQIKNKHTVYTFQPSRLTRLTESLWTDAQPLLVFRVPEFKCPPFLSAF